MKAVKIILGIIIGLSVLFFATGLIVKENKYSVDVTVNKPLTETFLLFNDMSKLQEWIPDIKSIDTIQLNTAVTGSIFEMVVDNKGQEVTMKQKVLAFIPNQKITLFVDAESMLKTDEYIFSEENGNTTITLNSKFVSEDSYILSCVFPYFKGTLKGIDQSYLNNFKTLIEN